MRLKQKVVRIMLGSSHSQYHVFRIRMFPAQVEPALHTTGLDKCYLSMISFFKAKYFILAKQTWKKKESRQ